ncbi:TonB-dependent receptor plug domain-containing protein [Alteraurantiacibacter buctensis]|uniref:TonB-dependent receptor n=1 Tax=Alteraurantiacibacter buctensis TaxID=1503981 RepID=A0A844YY97_9SPHN|nr:TonB-dependent receptor [Alteraurantiacibacter buctensis]MXO71057.1 TonB-dependent receptor [Alteraurantiacibacter buctensis]
MRRFQLKLSASLLAIAMPFAPAFAQQADQPDSAAADAEGNEGNAIIVTGSRIRSGTFNAPTPVTAVSADQLSMAAPGNMADALKQIPSVVPGGGTTAGGGTRAGGQNFLNLRGLGNSRTLVLLDNRRFVPTGPDLLADINLIPQGLVERVDVVTGGASAAYGSDAVAGVANFILNRRLTGLRVNATTGISQRGDNEEIRLSVNGGFSGLDGRLHVIAGGEYFENAGVRGDERQFRRTAGNQVLDPARPGFLTRIDDYRTAYTTGGLVVVGTGGTTANRNLVFGTQFGDGGNPLPYDYGTVSTTLRNATGTQNGGDGFRTSTGQEIVRPLNRTSAFTHIDLEVAAGLTLYTEGLYARTNSEFANSPTTRTFNISRNNPYLAQVAPALVTQLNALGLTGISMNRLTLERGPTLTTNENETIRGVVGAEGEIGNWSWDLSYQYGRNDTHSPTATNLITTNFTRALNAVVATAGNPGGIAAGTITCADLVNADATVRANAAGCSPFNPFGAGSPSSASLDYVFGTSVFDTRTTQQVVDASVSGSLFDLPAGPVEVAVGGEWRKVSAVTTADATSIAGGYRLINQQPFAGSVTVKEAFGEVQIPVFDGSAIGSFDVNLAARVTDYSTSGEVTTWKAGAVWQPVDELRIRGTYSRDIRAPNLEELFATGRQNNITIQDAFTNSTYLSVPNRTLGNAALTPEKAKTFVVGFVYQPNWLDNFSLAVDYFDIRITDAIANVGGQNAVEQCNLSNQTSPICAFVERNAANAVIGTRTSPFNLTSQETNGIDIETQYRTQLGESTDLTLRGFATYTGKNLTDNPFNAVNNDAVGDLAQSVQPRWRGTLSANLDNDGWGAFIQARYIHSFTWDRLRTLGVDTDFNHVPAQVYLDGQVSVKIEDWGGEQEVFLNVSNLLDKGWVYAPIRGGATPLPTNPNLYDQVGRMFRIGLRARF